MKNVTEYIKTNRKKMKLNVKNKGETGLKQKRICLKCGKKFPSKGPYNRICDKCSSMNERVSSSTYSIRKNPPSESSTLEKRLYEFN